MLTAWPGSRNRWRKDRPNWCCSCRGRDKPPPPPSIITRKWSIARGAQETSRSRPPPWPGRPAGRRWEAATRPPTAPTSPPLPFTVRSITRAPPPRVTFTTTPTRTSPRPLSRTTTPRRNTREPSVSRIPTASLMTNGGTSTPAKGEPARKTASRTRSARR